MRGTWTTPALQSTAATASAFMALLISFRSCMSDAPMSTSGFLRFNFCSRGVREVCMHHARTPAQLDDRDSLKLWLAVANVLSWG